MNKEDINRRGTESSQEQGHTEAGENFGYYSKGDGKSVEGCEQRVI